MKKPIKPATPTTGIPVVNQPAEKPAPPTRAEMVDQVINWLIASMSESAIPKYGREAGWTVSPAELSVIVAEAQQTIWNDAATEMPGCSYAAALSYRQTAAMLSAALRSADLEVGCRLPRRHEPDRRLVPATRRTAAPTHHRLDPRAGRRGPSRRTGGSAGRPRGHDPCPRSRPKTSPPTTPKSPPPPASGEDKLAAAAKAAAEGKAPAVAAVLQRCGWVQAADRYVVDTLGAVAAFFGASPATVTAWAADEDRRPRSPGPDAGAGREIRCRPWPLGCGAASGKTRPPARSAHHRRGWKRFARPTRRSSRLSWPSSRAESSAAPTVSAP